MAIREDLVASAAKFLQDPSVASSPVENRIAFLQAKNLTQDEVNAALARAATETGATPSYAPPTTSAVAQQMPPQAYYGQYPPYAWQPPPPEAPRRDWRDWFIMATVMGGVSYGLFALTKRYIYPLVAPPTPERLEQDKKSIDEQFERAFGLVEQLAKDTETLKAAEKERTERFDAALSELEGVIGDLKSANRRREDDAQRVRDDVQSLKDSLPRAMDAQKKATDERLKDVNTELKSLKTLISQRMNPGSTATPTSTGGYLRPSSGNAAPSGPAQGTLAASGAENTPETNGKAVEESKPRDYNNFASSVGRSSPFSSGSKASIPSWQKAMATKSQESSAATAAASNDAAGSSSSAEPAVGGSSGSSSGS